MNAKTNRRVPGLLAACGTVLGIWAAAHATFPYIPTVDKLIGQLGDAKAVRRTETALKLGLRGKEALPAVPVLEKAKEADPDPEVRLCALWAVAQVRAVALEAQGDRDGARALLAQCEARLIAALKAEEPGVRARAAQLMGRT
jgi:HEAT repeat protein